MGCVCVCVCEGLLMVAHRSVRSVKMGKGVGGAVDTDNFNAN